MAPPFATLHTGASARVGTGTNRKPPEASQYASPPIAPMMDGASSVPSIRFHRPEVKKPVGTGSVT